MVKNNSVMPDGNTIRKVRLDKGWSQERLAEESGIRKRAIGRIENNHQTYITTLSRIATALGVDTKTLKLEDKPCLPEGIRKSNHKYLRDMWDVLQFDTEQLNELEKTATWFRCGGPNAADFRGGTVVERGELLGKLNELVFNNKISILEGDGGTGKSVLARNFAYNLINTEKVQSIYHYSFKTDSQIGDLDIFLNILNKIDGIVIIEDIHLASISDIHSIVNDIKLRDNSHLLLTARPSYKEHQSKYHPEKLLELPTLPIRERSGLGQEDDICKIIDSFVQKNPRSFQWTDEIKHSIKKVSSGDLWQLSYALNGCTGEGEAITWLKKGVLKDLEKIEKQYKCNPEILLALCPLYRNEILTAKSFLTQTLGFDRNEINELVRIGEIIEHHIEDEIFYGMQHSSLAKAYWENGASYRNIFPELEEFIHNYAVSGVSNGLTAILKYKVNDTIPKKILTEAELLEVTKKEKGDRAYWWFDHYMRQYLYLEWDLSPEFMYSLGDIFLQKGFFYGLSTVLNTFNSEELKRFWQLMRKKLFIDNYTDDYLYVWQCLDCISKCEKEVKSEICKLIDCDTLALKSVQSEDLEAIEQIVKCIFQIDKKIGMKFWGKFNKDKLAQILYSTEDYYIRNSFAITLADVYPKGLKKFIDSLSISKLEAYLKHSDSFMRAGFIGWLCSVGSKNARKLMHIFIKDFGEFNPISPLAAVCIKTENFRKELDSHFAKKFSQHEFEEGKIKPEDMEKELDIFIRENLDKPFVQEIKEGASVDDIKEEFFKFIILADEDTNKTSNEM